MVSDINTNFENAEARDEYIAFLRTKYPEVIVKRNTRYSYSISIPDMPNVAVPAPAPPPPPPVPLPEILIADDFEGTDGLITNEFSYWNPNDVSALRSPVWEMTSGSLFRQGGQGWTGIPDNIGPDRMSLKGNNSAVFRANTKRKDILDAKISFSFLASGFTTTSSTPAVEWDGVHVWMRYQSQYHLYYASVLRRDGACVIKKKVPVGPSNGGTYTHVTNYVPTNLPLNQLHKVEVTMKNISSDEVEMALWVNGKLIVRGIDKLVGNAPSIVQPGSVGIRGDNCNFHFDHFKVVAL
jgi:hypothetical protein